MNPHMPMPPLPLPVPPAARRGMRTGIDIVQISRIRESMANFGERFARRLFTRAEIDYAQTDAALAPERFAARFAAKEAAIKAFDLSEAGIDWRDIEVQRDAAGRCSLFLHGKAARAAGMPAPGELALSLSHDGDYAVAIVVAAAPGSAGALSTPSTTNDH